ncbi:MAG: PAS domain S-box protein, partial [Deltaproteobacteria bacterium]|nr:PAS domain S-box protein [Deltaproteobacteria bacterium]
MDTDRFASIIENMQEGYYEIDLKGSFTFVNKAICKIAKLPMERLIGLNYREYVTEETAKRLFKIFNRIYRTGEPGNVEYEVIRGDGSRATILNSVSLLKDKTGKKMGFYGLAMDITSRKEMEENLRQSQERFEALFENANEMIITTDENGFVARLNKKVEEISGYSREELLGESILKIAYPEDRKEYIKFWKELLEGKRPIKELRGQTRDGKVRTLIASGSVIKKGDKILEIQYNAHDITYMKEARKTIDELRERLKSIIESSPNIIICLDRNAKIILVNPVCDKIFNRPQNSLVGQDFFSIDPSMERYRKYFEKVLEENKPVILP